MIKDNSPFVSSNRQPFQTLPLIIQMALIEDNAFNDITSDLTIDEFSICAFQINARQDLVFCGKKIVEEVFLQLKKSKKFADCEIKYNFLVDDGEIVKKSQNIVEGHGSDKLVLVAERLILNLVQHLSAIATTTHKFVKKLNNPRIKILDTRKTLPNLRELQKYGVLCGGGYNHRFSLADLILIKDNHINACKGVENAMQKVCNLALEQKIEIECDNLIQVGQVLKFKPNIIMLDNMEIAEIEESIELIRKNSPQTLIEVSGGINLENIEKYSTLDIDFISIGSLTNSCQNIDIGLDFL